MSKLDKAVLNKAAKALVASKKRWKDIFPFLGPAFITSVAYMDPGNFATNVTGGATYGYALLWVIAVANLAAMFIQYLSAKIGIVTQKNLPELIAERLPRMPRYFYWIQAEVMAMATDLAEFLGAALAFHLLLGLPLLWGAILTAIISYGLLALQRWGFRPLEAAISLFVGVIALCYVVELFFSRPDPMLWLGFVPGFKDAGMVYLAVSIFGATVMPHVIYLHSALTQDRIPTKNDQEKKRLLWFTKIEIVIALGLAGLINLAMLIAAAAAFYQKGLPEMGDLTVAYQTLAPLLGPFAATAFAIALLSSGLSSSTVGTLSGQIIMQGFVSFRIPLVVRRLLTMIPSFIVIMAGVNVTQSLVFSQVVLSFGIPLALVPMLIYAADKKLMGQHASKGGMCLIGWIIAAGVITLNLYLLLETLISL